MSCCATRGYGTVFGAGAAARDARRYRRKGLSGSARWLTRTLIGGGVAGCSLLEVGGGVGALQIELLEAGAAHAANVEIVDSYEEAARALLAERGLEARVDRRVADFAADPSAAAAADLVVMHRVVCCYPDGERLLAAACARARDRVAVTLPRRTWWVRAGFAAMNASLALRRIAFRGYAHRRERLLAVAREHGFGLVASDRGRLWESFIVQLEAARPAD